MSRKTYHDVLELEWRALDDQIARLNLTSEHDRDESNRLRHALDIRGLQRRTQAIERRLRELEDDGGGLWEDLMVNVRWVADGLASSFECWTEHIAAQRTAKRQHPDEPN